MLPRYPGWFAATFWVTIFFRSDHHRPEMVIQWGFWQDLGPGHLEQFRAWAENRKKRNFPVQGGPERKKKLPRYAGDGCPQLSYNVRFDRPDPHGRKNTKYFISFELFEYFGPFCPRTAVGA